MTLNEPKRGKLRFKLGFGKFVHLPSVIVQTTVAVNTLVILISIGL